MKLYEELVYRWEHFPVYARLFPIIGVNPTLFISRILWWQDGPESWVSRSREEIEDATGLSRDQQLLAKRTLTEFGWLDEKHDRLKHRTWFRVNIDAIKSFELPAPGNPASGDGKPGAPVTGKPSPTYILKDSGKDRDKTFIPLPLLRSMDTTPDAERIYQLYPRKADRKTALTAIRRSLRLFGLELIESRTSAFAQACAANQPDAKFIPYPATWFNKQRFNDESTWPQPNGHSTKSAKTLREKDFDRLMRETDRGIAEIDACADRIEAENRRLA